MSREYVMICLLASMLLASLLGNLMMAVENGEQERRNARMKKRVAQLKAENREYGTRLALAEFLRVENAVKMQAALRRKDALLNQKWHTAKGE